MFYWREHTHPHPQSAEVSRKKAATKIPPNEPIGCSANWLLRVTLTSYRALLEFVELTLDEAEHQAGLPDGRLAQQHQFKLTDLVPGVGSIGSRGASPSGHGLLRSPGVLLGWKLCVRTSAAGARQESKQSLARANDG